MIDLSHDNSGKDPSASRRWPDEVGRQIAAGRRRDRRRDARVVPGRRTPGPRTAPRSSSTASRSPTAASAGTRPSRCSTGWPLRSGPAVNGRRRRLRAGMRDCGPRRRADRRLGGARRAPAAGGVGRTGYDAAPEALERARELGALDASASSVADAVADAEAVFVAVAGRRPVRARRRGAGRGRRRLRGHRRRLDQARRRRRPRRPAVRRRPPAGRRRDRRRRARPRRPVRGRDLVPDADPRQPRGCCTSACTGCCTASARSPTAIDAETHDTILATVSHLPARARQRARRPGRGDAGRWRRAGCRRPARASATRPAWPARRARSGPTSTSPTATR